METAFVQPSAADYAIALEGFVAGYQLRRPYRHHCGASQLRQHLPSPLVSACSFSLDEAA
jgi:hypothetical protein